MDKQDRLDTLQKVYAELEAYSIDHIERVAKYHIFDECHGKILNAGCGKGESAERWPGSHGFDFNPEAAKLWKPEWNFIQAEASNLPYDDKEFDYVISTDFLEHIERWHIQAVLKELTRVGRKNIHAIAKFSRPVHKRGTHIDLHPLGIQPHGWIPILDEAGVDYEIFAPAAPNYTIAVWK